MDFQIGRVNWRGISLSHKLIILKICQPDAVSPWITTKRLNYHFQQSGFGVEIICCMFHAWWWLEYSKRWKILKLRWNCQNKKNQRRVGNIFLSKIILCPQFLLPIKILLFFNRLKSIKVRRWQILKMNWINVCFFFIVWNSAIVSALVIWNWFTAWLLVDHQLFASSPNVNEKQRKNYCKWEKIGKCQ